MKRVICAAALCAVLCLTGCAGAGDWASEPLTGNYEIWRSSAHVIKLVERTDKYGGHVVIGAEIYAVAWTDDYILVQHEAPEPDPADYTREPHGELDCYIFLVDGAQVLGPFDVAGFAAACREQGIPAPEVWTPVRELPRQPER